MRWFIALLLSVSAAFADPVPYTLDKERSIVGFTVDMSGDELKGNMDVANADIALDLSDLSQSRANVTLDVQSAVTERSFATDAMLGRNVLHADEFPTIRFVSQSVSGSLSGGKVSGLVTIRDVTRPITLDVQVFRQRDSDAGDLSRLSVLLKGSIDRRDFGADGFAQFVGPTIDIEILTRLDRS